MCLKQMIMRKKEFNKKEYVRPNARLVIFNYTEVVMSSGPVPIPEGQMEEIVEDENEPGPIQFED